MHRPSNPLNPIEKKNRSLILHRSGKVEHLRRVAAKTKAQINLVTACSKDEYMTMLLVDDQFPDIELSIAGGGTLSLPKDVEGSWTYVLFYRGGW